RGPRGDLVAGLELPQDRSGLRVEGAQVAVAAAREADPGRRRRDAAALRLRGLELPDAFARGDVDRADRAVVVPALEEGAEVAVLEPEEHVADELVPELRLRERRLLLDGGGLS